MVESRSSRSERRKPRAAQTFGKQSGAALAVFELLEMAWHDCYGETPPPDAVLEDVWTASRGRIDDLAVAAHLAVIDFRDLRVNADQLRERKSHPDAGR